MRFMIFNSCPNNYTLFGTIIIRCLKTSNIGKAINESFKLTFAEIEQIAGLLIDHSFLNYKKELLEYGTKS